MDVFLFRAETLLFFHFFRVSLLGAVVRPVPSSSGNPLATHPPQTGLSRLDFSHGCLHSLQREARLARPDPRILPLARHYHRRLGSPQRRSRSKIPRPRGRDHHPTRELRVQTRSERRGLLRRPADAVPFGLGGDAVSVGPVIERRGWFAVDRARRRGCLSQHIAGLPEASRPLAPPEEKSGESNS